MSSIATSPRAKLPRWPSWIGKAADNWGLLLVQTLFVALSLTYNLATPPFEGADEHRHYAYVRHLAQGRGLPAKDTAPPDLTSYGVYQEGGQPPLYYALAALLTFSIPGADDVEAALAPNPFFNYPAPPLTADNKNFWLRSPAIGTLRPGFVWALRLARGVSTIFGVLAIAATYRLAALYFDGNGGLATLCAAWLAFNPMFIFVSSVTTNDAAAACAGAGLLLLTLRWVAQGPSLQRSLMWGSLIGLAVLTKASLFAVLPICAVGFVLGERRQPTMKALAHAGALSGAAVLIGGWWYLRNLLLGEGLFGISPHLAAPWAASQQSPLGGLARLWVVEHSYWAGFGWGMVGRPAWLYTMILWWERLGLLGVLVALWRDMRHSRRHARMLIAMILWLFACLAALLWWLQSMAPSLGRLLFPAAGAASTLMGIGWHSWTSRASTLRLPVIGRWVLPTMTGLLLLLAGATVPLFIRPAFALPRSLQGSKPEIWTSPHLVLHDDGQALATMSLTDARPDSVGVGEWVSLRVCWQGLTTIDKDYEAFVQLVGKEDTIVALRHTHPGLGRHPTSAWQPGITFCDNIRLAVEVQAPAPAIYAGMGGLYDTRSERRLDTYNAAGHRVSQPILGWIRVVSDTVPSPPPHRLSCLLDNQIELTGYDLRAAHMRPGETLSLTLYWHAERKPASDYTVFVHLLDQEGQIVSQADGVPRSGAYPTSWWASGEDIVDVHHVSVPTQAGTGQHTLVVGLYDPETGDRLLPVEDECDKNNNGAVWLQEVTVAP